jgi:hypothetical protein
MRKAWSIKGKIDKLGLITITIFYSTKANVKRMQRQATDQKKIFANHISSNGLVYKIYKEQ